MSVCWRFVACRLVKSVAKSVRHQKPCDSWWSIADWHGHLKFAWKTNQLVCKHLSATHWATVKLVNVHPKLQSKSCTLPVQPIILNGALLLWRQTPFPICAAILTVSLLLDEYLATANNALSYMQITGDHSNLLIIKAITRQFLVQVHIALCSQFHLVTASSLQQPLREYHFFRSNEWFPAGRRPVSRSVALNHRPIFHVLADQCILFLQIAMYWH